MDHHGNPGLVHLEASSTLGEFALNIFIMRCAVVEMAC
jgi:hypothetical protein